MRFEWDPLKNKTNQKKHGISFEDAIFVFTDKKALSIFDEDHSELEERWVTIGMIPDSRIIVVVHTDIIYFENKKHIRIISARKATKNETKNYLGQ